jgi:hypothetical protein
LGIIRLQGFYVLASWAVKRFSITCGSWRIFLSGAEKTACQIPGTMLISRLHREGRARNVDKSAFRGGGSTRRQAIRTSIEVPQGTSSESVDNHMHALVFRGLKCLFINALHGYQRLWKTWGFHNSVL